MQRLDNHPGIGDLYSRTETWEQVERKRRFPEIHHRATRRAAVVPGRRPQGSDHRAYADVFTASRERLAACRWAGLEERTMFEGYTRQSNVFWWMALRLSTLRIRLMRGLEQATCQNLPTRTLLGARRWAVGRTRALAAGKRPSSLQGRTCGGP